jgi:hypothetical protein
MVIDRIGRDEVENLVGAFDDGLNLDGAKPTLRAIRFCQHDHSAHYAIVQPLLTPLLFDLGQRHR